MAISRFSFIRLALLGGAVPLALAGCDPNPNNCNGLGQNTASGALIGAGVGAALGDGSRYRPPGSIDKGTGALLGAAAGAMIGNSVDNQGCRRSGYGYDNYGYSSGPQVSTEVVVGTGWGGGRGYYAPPPPPPPRGGWGPGPGGPGPGGGGPGGGGQGWGQGGPRPGQGGPGGPGGGGRYEQRPQQQGQQQGQPGPGPGGRPPWQQPSG